MRRVLLITYGFPPVTRVQAQGAARLARGLAAHGWDVHVLTVKDPPTHLIDKTPTSSAPTSATVHTAYSLEPTRILQALRRLRGHGETSNAAASSQAPERSYTSLSPGIVRLLRACFRPDEKIGWAPFAVDLALKLHAETPFAAVISTGPPYTDHVIARAIARKTSLPWLAVLMDPIVGCYAFPPVNNAHARYFMRLERSVAQEAGAIAVATQPWIDQLVERNPGSASKCIELPNSFDPAAFAGPPPPAHDGFVVTYVGTFQLTIRPDDLLDAVVELRRDAEIARDLRVRFVGPTDPQTDAAIAARGLGDVVERTGLLGHGEAIAEMRAADLLVLVLGPEEESRGILTGKLPEYLAAGQPILAIAPQGVATATVLEAEAGEAVSPGDVAEVETSLRRAYARWKTGRISRPNPDVVARFDQTRIMADLDCVLADLVGASPPKEAP